MQLEASPGRDREGDPPAGIDGAGPGSHHEFLALDLLWRLLYAPDGKTATCRQCGKARPFHRVSGRRAYACGRCGWHIYPAAHTPFAGSPIELSAWFEATMHIVDRTDVLKPRQLAERLGFTYKKAWLMSKRINEALCVDGDEAALLRKIGASWKELVCPGNEIAYRSKSPEDRIRAAACRIIAERGVSSARIADVAHEAGLSPGSVHYYFRSKDDMLLDAFRWASERLHSILRDLLDEDIEPTAMLCRILDLSIPSDESMADEYILWLEVWVRVRNDPRFLAACTGMSRRWYEVVLEVFRRGTQAGVFAPVTTIEEVCDRYAAISESLAFRSTLKYEDVPLAKARRVLARFAAEQLGIPAERLNRT